MKMGQVIGLEIPTRLLVAPERAMTDCWTQPTSWCVSHCAVTYVPQWAETRYRTQHGLSTISRCTRNDSSTGRLEKTGAQRASSHHLSSFPCFPYQSYLVLLPVRFYNPAHHELYPS